MDHGAGAFRVGNPFASVHARAGVPLRAAFGGGLALVVVKFQVVGDGGGVCICQTWETGVYYQKGFVGNAVLQHVCDRRPYRFGARAACFCGRPNDNRRTIIAER